MADKDLSTIADALMAIAFPKQAELSAETQAALKTAATRLAAKAGTPEKQRGPLRQQILGALYAAREHAALIEAMDREVNFPRPGTAPVFWRLNALQALGRLDEVKTELTSMDFDPAHPVSFSLIHMFRHARVEPSPANVERLFGPSRGTLAEVLEHLPTQAWRSSRLDMFADRLYDLCDRDMDREAYRNRLAWGTATQILLMFIGSRMVFPQFRAEMVTQCPPLDVAPLVATAQGPRSILLAQAHTGTRPGHIRRVAIPGLPNLLLNKRGGDTVGNSTVIATDTNPHLGLLGAIKLVRKTPHFITIFPDGPEGSDHVKRDLFGQTIHLGAGAASLAWHGKAATFFTTARWDGTTLQQHLEEGPAANPDMDREEFDAAFHDFYVEQLRKIALGPPENIGPPGRVFSGFLR